MNDEAELSEAVMAALGANRKIEAIKLVRQEKNVDLKQAKAIVDAYIAENPDVVPARSRTGSLNVLPLLLAAAVTVVAYFVYKSFT